MSIIIVTGNIRKYYKARKRRILTTAKESTEWLIFTIIDEKKLRETIKNYK